MSASYKIWAHGLLLTLTFVGSAAVAKMSTSTTENQMMSELFDGPPKLADSALDPSAYVEERVQKLNHAQIAYVNWKAVTEIMTELGYKNMPQELTPELTEAILSRAGFVKPMPGEPADTYAQAFRTLYSIRYGGHWINFNFGAGRVDIKGIGKTVLVRPWADAGHSNGTMTLSECMKEVIWSNILHEELPLGANRVLFVITTGTNVDGNHPDGEPRAILVREDPMRPAYFQQNDGVTQTLMDDALREMHTEADRMRMEKVLPRLIDALPKPVGLNRHARPVEILSAGLFEMVDRIALQYAKGYVGQIFLSGISTSNVEIGGTALDYGATTAVIGYPKARYLKGEAPNGSAESLKSDLILEFAQDLRAALPPALQPGVPSDEQLAARLDAQFAMRVGQNFLELAGTPREYSPRMILTDSGRRLAAVIKTIAEAGNSEIIEWSDELARKGTYNLERVLTALAAKTARGWTADDEFKRALPDPALRHQLSSSFETYLAELEMLALPDFVSRNALIDYMQLATPARNRSLYRLRWRRKVETEFKAIAKRFAGDPNIVQQYAEKAIAQNTREFKAPPFQLIVSDNSQLARGLGGRKVFDLRRGTVSRVTTPLPGFYQKPRISLAPDTASSRCTSLLLSRRRPQGG